jgi:hypothetical protein
MHISSPTQPALLYLDRRLKILSSACSLPIFLNKKSRMKLYLFQGDVAAATLRLRIVEGGFIGVASGRQAPEVTAFSSPSLVAFYFRSFLQFTSICCTNITLSDVFILSIL